MNSNETVRRSSRWKAVVAIAGLTILSMAVVAILLLRSRPLETRETRPVKTIPSSVSAWGRLAPQSDVIPLSAAANQFVACVESLLVMEGDTIVVGQPIAILDTHQLRKAAVDEAKARVVSAQAKWAAVQAGAKPEEIAVQQALIEANQAEFEEAKEQYERGLRLIASRSISEEDQASRSMRWKKATAAMSQARSQLEALKNPRAEDVAFAKSEVLLAESSLVVAQANLEQSVIRSPIDGQVLRVHARQGQKIGEAGVVDIGDTRLMHAIAEVYEEDIGRIHLGQNANVFVPSLQRSLKGKVERISQIVARKSVFSNDPVEDTDARVVEVRIVLDAADSQLVSGLSNARIHARIDAPPLAEIQALEFAPLDAMSDEESNSSSSKVRAVQEVSP